MKKICAFLLTGFFILSASVVFGQKLVSGDVSMLKGQTVLNLKYDYSNMVVGKYKDEQAYINDGIADRNKKKPGSGDEWAKKWVSDRADRFQPMFEKNLNGMIDKFGVSAKEGLDNAKYTLVCHTTFTEQGFNSVVGPRKNAYINMTVTVVETANPGTALATIVIDKCESINMMGYDYDTGGRIQSCYDRAGEMLGKFLVKNVLK